MILLRVEKMGLKNRRRRAIRCLFLGVIMLVQIIGPMISNLKFTPSNPMLTEAKNQFYHDSPEINAAIYDCYDLININDLVLTAKSSSGVYVRNVSNTNYRNENFIEHILENEFVYSFHNNGNITFIAMDGNYYNNYSEVGFIENNDINTLHKIIGTNLSFIHRIKHRNNNLFLFGQLGENLYCEIYDISILQSPLKITEWNLSSENPTHFEYRNGLNLDYQFHENFFYHSTGDNKLIIYDISNITSPLIVKKFNQNYSRVIFQDEIFYGLTENRLEILNNSDPLNPTMITNYEITLPQGLTILGNNIYIITEREMIILEKVGVEIIFRSNYKMEKIINLKFCKIIVNNQFAFILTEQYTTGVSETQSDLFILDIENKMKIKRLYPKIEMPFGLQMFLFYFAIFGIPIICIILAIAIYAKRLEKKNNLHSVKKQHDD